METLIIHPHNVCSQKMTIEHENGVIIHASVEGGCRGNLQGICRLIEGMRIEQVISRLQGVKCRNGTSCPDQLAKGLTKLIK